LLVTAVGLGLGCDGITSVANPELPLWVNHPGAAMSVMRSRELTAPGRKVGEPYERGKPEIDHVHRRVFVGSSDFGLYALDAVTLTTIWRFETDGAVQSEPLYDGREDVVYFGSNDGAMYKLSAVDGRMLWRFASAAEITRAPILHRGLLYFVNANDTLVALEPDTGTMRWFRHREPAAGMEIAGYAGPSAFGDMIYTSFSDGAVMAYRASDGAEAWTSPVDLAADAEQTVGRELRYLDVDTTAPVDKAGDVDAIFVASYEGGVYALDAQSGGRVWNNDGVTGVTELILWTAPVKEEADAAKDAPAPRGGPKGARKPTPRHRILIASSGLTGMWGLDPDTGEERWHRDIPVGGLTAAEPWAGALLVGTTRFGFFLFHPLDGGVIDGLHSGGAFAAAPAAYGRHAYILSNEGKLFGLTIHPPTDPRPGI
jgi:outer membrane protein assembly factor BamB